MVSDVAVEHAGEGADTLRRAILIEDPYMQADAVWEAALRARSAAEHLSGGAADRCIEIACQLEEGCEAAGQVLSADALRACADSLDAI
jgi:hypothetical protein